MRGRGQHGGATAGPYDRLRSVVWWQLSQPGRSCAECLRQFERQEAEEYPCTDDDGSLCPLTTVEPEDSRALSLYHQATALAEIGLAPVALDALRLRVTPTEYRGLVGRLVAIVDEVAQHRAQEWERRGGGAGVEGVVDAVERGARRRRG